MNKEIRDIDIKMIDLNPNQPRKSFDKDSIKELAQSIEENGLIQPIVVRKMIDRYELVAGERRLRAFKYLKRAEISAIIDEYSDIQSKKLSIIENIQRENLSVIEEASAYQKLINEVGISQIELARQLGKSQSSVANKIRLLKLENSVQKSLLDKMISERHGRALLKIKDSKKQKEVLNKIITENLNVEETENYIDSIIVKKNNVRKSIVSKKDYRLEINTIKQALDLIDKSGVRVEYNINKNDDNVEIKIVLTK